MKITIQYSVDNDNWDEDKFESEPHRELIIDDNMLSNILRTFGGLNKDEFLHEIEHVIY